MKQADMLKFLGRIANGENQTEKLPVSSVRAAHRAGFVLSRLEFSTGILILTDKAKEVLANG